MPRPAALLSAALLTLLVATAARAIQDRSPQAATPVAITHVAIIDVRTGATQTDQTVIIAGRRIEAVGSSTTVRPPRGARVLEGRGKVLIPGLWDMHVHLGMTGRSALALYVANGVTGVRDMGGDLSVIRPWRDSVAAGTLLGPRIRTAGPIVESARWLQRVIQMSSRLESPGLDRELRRRLGITSAEDARRAVDTLVAAGVDFVKIRNFPGPEAYFALAREVRTRGLRLAGHAPIGISLGDVSDSGFASFEHTIIGVRNDTLVNASDLLAPAEREALFRRLARNNTAYDPTLVSTRIRLIPDSLLARLVVDSTGTIDPRLAYASSQVLAQWGVQFRMRKLDTPLDWTPIYRSNLRDIREMAAAGVPILSGTDVPVPSLVPGFSLHDELELLVAEGGLTPLQALQAATVNPARTLGLGDSLGTVSADAIADLAILDGDPLTDIRRTRSIFAVVAAGRLLDRRELDRLLGSVARRRP